MTSQETIIEKIKSAVKLEDVVSIGNLKGEFNAIVKEIHPDICSIPGASEATTKMNLWKDEYENGRPIKDDIGIYRTNGYWAEFNSTSKNLAWSIENYRIFKDLVGSNHDHFRKYIPPNGKLLADGTFRFEFDKRAIPLSGLKLPQEHVNWILNRLLEYCAYLSEVGFSHCGLNPESVFIIPETHGIQICSFYHLTKFGNKIGTISGKYANWYPQDTFINKISNPSIDIELVKRIAVYLLGETSGNGVKLKKTHNEDFINFVINQTDNAYKTLIQYRELLKKNFKIEFHILSL
jgi:hypothetical protein